MNTLSLKTGWLLGLCLLLGGALQAQVIEDFASLNNWKEFSFGQDTRKTSYQTIQQHGLALLKMESRQSASGMVHKQLFSTRHFPYLEWKWKVQNVYEQGDAATKAGDDFPVRIYVMFPYDPDKADFWERMQFETYKGLHGYYPPHRSLCYVWSNRPQPHSFQPNPYSARVMQIFVQQGASQTGQWILNHANIRADYRQAFGEDAPEMARIGIMNDSDNTGEGSISYLEFLRTLPESDYLMSLDHQHFGQQSNSGS